MEPVPASEARQAAAVQQALTNSATFTFIVDSTGWVSASWGGFAPTRHPVGSIETVLAREAADSGLMQAVVNATVRGTATTVDFTLAGIPCHAVCAPIGDEGGRALVILVPRFSEAKEAPVTTHAEPSTDVSALVAGSEGALREAIGAGRDLFVQVERTGLTVAASAETVRRALDLLMEAPAALQPRGGPSLLRIRALADGQLDPYGVEVRLRVYTSEATPAALSAMETACAEFESVTGTAMYLAPGDHAVEIVATFRTLGARAEVVSGTLAESRGTSATIWPLRAGQES